MEMTYGSGRNTSGVSSNFLNADLTVEKPKILYGLGYKNSRYPEYHADTASPYLRYFFTDRFSIWGKYFISRDSDGIYTHSVWSELGYRHTDRIRFKAGITRGDRLFDIEYASEGNEKFESFIAGFLYSFSEDFNFQYIFETVYQGPSLKNRKNSLVLDIKF